MPTLAPVRPQTIGGIERRAFSNAEVRVSATGKRTITGYAAVFNSLSGDLGGFREQIAPGAFAGTLHDDVRALWNHDPNFVLGRSKSGTLELSEDSRGLKVSIDPPDTTWARDVLASIARGDVSGMSFAFETIRDRWDSAPTGETMRTLLEVKLFDVSPVTFPAYSQTEVSVRSASLLGLPQPPTGWYPSSQPAQPATYVYRFIPERLVPALFRSIVHNEISRAAGQLKIPVPTVRWFAHERSIPVRLRETTGRFWDRSEQDAPVLGFVQPARRDAICLRATGRLDEIIRSALHEIFHIAQLSAGAGPWYCSGPEGERAAERFAQTVYLQPDSWHYCDVAPNWTSAN